MTTVTKTIPKLNPTTILLFRDCERAREWKVLKQAKVHLKFICALYVCLHCFTQLPTRRFSVVKYLHFVHSPLCGVSQQLCKTVREECHRQTCWKINLLILSLSANSLEEFSTAKQIESEKICKITRRLNKKQTEKLGQWVRQKKVEIAVRLD